MDLLDRYLQAVGFWLPKPQKQDILQELAEDIRSQMEDKQAELNRPLNNGDVQAILKQCGRPMLVAARYLPQRHLIGPVLFPVYAFVLKIAAIGYLIPWLLVWTGFMIFDQDYRTRHIGLGLLHDWVTFWQLALFLFGVITIVFAILEWAQSNRQFLENWDPCRLPAVARRPSRQAQAIFELAFSMVFIFGWLALPYMAASIFPPFDGVFKLTPDWSPYYWVILCTQLAVFGQQCLAMSRPQWSWLRPAGQMFANASAFVVVLCMLSTPPYILPANQAALERYGHALRPINQIVFYSLACFGLGMLIACIVYAVKFFLQFRRFQHGLYGTASAVRMWL